MIEFSNIALWYQRSKPLLQEANGCVEAGSLICLVGGNGVGKSTLLRTLSGLEPLRKGNVLLNGLPLANYSVRQRSKLIAMVLTDDISLVPLSVEELVGLGRIPYLNWRGQLSVTDMQIVEHALTELNLNPLTKRIVPTLSDGERQRVTIARALAQQTPYLLMDEPLAHLDLPAKLQVMSIFKRLARNQGIGILVSTHEINIARQFADQLWLLPDGGPLIQDTPEGHIKSGSLNQLFGSDVVRYDSKRDDFILLESP